MPENITDKAKNIALQAEGSLAPKLKLPQQNEQNVVSGFTSSVLSSALGSFGIPELKSAEQFNAEHPVAGGVAGMTGAVLPYLVPGAAKAKLKPFDNFIEGFAEKGSNEFTKGVRRSAAMFAPLEAAKVAGQTIADPSQLGEASLESGINLGIEMAAGGLFGAMSSAGKVLVEPPAPLGTVYNEAKQLRLRDTLKELGKEGLDEGAKLDLQRTVSELERDIRFEDVGLTGVSFKLADETADGRDVGRLFKDTSSSKGNVSRKKIARTANGFQTDEEVSQILKAANLEGNLDAVSLPRHISFGRKTEATTVQSAFLKRGKFTTLDDNTLYSKTEDGTFLMVKKIAGTIGKAEQTDQYVVFRTSQPGRFSPEIKEYADAVNERMLFLRNEDRIRPTGSTILDQANRIVTSAPLREFQEGVNKVGFGDNMASRLASHLGFAPGEIGSNFAVHRGKAFVEHYLTPALHSFKSGVGASHAAYIWGNARMIRDSARLMSHRLINGEAISDATKGFSKVFSNGTSSGEVVLEGGRKLRSVQRILDSLDDEDIKKFHEVAELVAGGDDVISHIDDLYRSGTVSKALHQGLKDMNELDKYLVNEVRTTQRAAGDIELNPLEGHLMLSRVWEGDFRAPIYNEAGDLVYMASGATPKAADAHAKAVIAESGKKGLKAESAEKFDAKQDLNLASRMNLGSGEYALLAQANKRLVSNPQTFKERGGIEGFKKNFTRKELKDRLTSHINERTDYIAGLATKTSLDREIATLQDIDPKMYNTLMKRLEQLQEKPGAFSTGVNRATDALLKPVLGRNSATKISAGVNEFFFATQLGLGNLAFPVLNAMTFIQTVIPEVAYVTKAAPNRIMRDYYEVAIAGGSDLKPRGGVHFLSTPKIMLQSVKKMMNAKNDIPLSLNLDRAVAEGVVDPKLLEEFIGKSSATEVSLNEVLKGDESLFNFMRSLSGWLPSKSERLARGHSFIVGHIVGKDILGLSDEALYTFSKKFTERTMYNYGTADRATIMTGPVGRTFGLFKNWQTHYLFSMMQYGEEAVKHKNFAPLLWQMGGTAAVGGVSATPIYGVADAFSRMVSDEPLMNHIYEQFGGTDPDDPQGGIADAVFMGLPAFLGISLSGNASAPGSDPMRDAAQMASFPQWRRMVQLGEAMGEAFDNWGATGNHPINSESVRDKLTAALAPKIWARNAAITNEMALKSLTTGKTVINDLNVSERILWGMGFTPRRVGLSYEAANELWKDQNKKKQVTTSMGKAWMEAQASQDWDTLWEIQQRAMVLGVDISSVVRSADAFRTKSEEEQIPRQFSPESRMRMQDLGLPGF